MALFDLFDEKDVPFFIMKDHGYWPYIHAPALQ
jgi:hypothetical protein